MELLNTKQMRSLLDLARSLNSITMIAEWSSWRREAAILHLFLHITMNEDGKKIAHKILQENPEGDCKKLLEFLNRLNLLLGGTVTRIYMGRLSRALSVPLVKSPGTRLRIVGGFVHSVVNLVANRRNVGSNHQLKTRPRQQT